MFYILYYVGFNGNHVCVCVVQNENYVSVLHGFEVAHETMDILNFALAYNRFKSEIWALL